MFCVEDVIKITSEWKYDEPKLNPLMIDKDWKYDPFGADASGRRFYNITNQSYRINFRGEFEDIFFDGWEGSLKDQNDLKTSGETIPTAWKSNNGYTLPLEASVFNFSREYTVQKTKLNPGELSCPNGNNIKFCQYKNTFLGVSVDLGAQLSATGSIAQIDIDDISTLTINGSILRNTKVLINDNPKDDIATNISNEVTMLNLVEDGGLKPKNIKLSGKVKFEGTPKNVNFSGEGEGEADFVYEEEQETASVFAQYLEEASSNFIDAGEATLFEVTLNDSIAMTAEIFGNSFESSTVFTETRLQNALSSAFTVFDVVEKTKKEIPEPSNIIGIFVVLGLGSLITKSKS